MTRREPSDEAILAARLQRAYQSLSPYSSASLAQQLCAIERMQRRHAERCCSGEDGGYVMVSARAKSGPARGPNVLVHDPDAEERAGKRIDRAKLNWMHSLGGFIKSAAGDTSHEIHGNARWTRCEIELQGDPRGAVLKVRFPGEPEASSV